MTTTQSELGKMVVVLFEKGAGGLRLAVSGTQVGCAGSGLELSPRIGWPSIIAREPDTQGNCGELERSILAVHSA